MLSKIAGHNEFHKITKSKASKAFMDKTAKNSKRILETAKTKGETSGGFSQQTPYDAFLSQQTLAEIKKAQLFKKG